MTGQAVWLVQVRGKRRFSCECAVKPSRSGDTTAEYMLIIVSASGGRMIGGAGLYAERQRIETLGSVIELHA